VSQMSVRECCVGQNKKHVEKDKEYALGNLDKISQAVTGLGVLQTAYYLEECGWLCFSCVQPARVFGEPSKFCGSLCFVSHRGVVLAPRCLGRFRADSLRYHGPLL